MVISAFIGSYLSAFLHLWARLVMAVLWLLWSPVVLLCSSLVYILTHGWTLALGIAALTCIALRYQRRRHSSSRDCSMQQSSVIDEVFKTLPVLPKNGWNIERVCQGIRTHSRFFPSLVTSSSTSLVAATTLLIDSKIKYVMQYLLNPTDMQLWFGPVQGAIHSSIGSHVAPSGSDILRLTIKKDYKFGGDLKRGLINFMRHCSQFVDRWCPFLSQFIPLYTDFSPEKIERSWQSVGDTSYVFSSLSQSTPTSLPFRWALFIVSETTKETCNCSILTVVLCPQSPSHLLSSSECLASQISSLKQHILMNQFKAYDINYSLKEATPITPPTNAADTSTEGQPTGVVEGETRPLPSSTTQVSSGSKRRDPPSDHAPLSNGIQFMGPYAEYDQRYFNSAVKCAEDLIAVSKATVDDGWISLGTSKGIAILKKIPQKGEPPINSVKGSGKINCPPEFLIRILMDSTYSKQLDDLLDKMTPIKEVDDHVQLMYLKYKAFWPTTARDFCVLSVFGQFDKSTFVHAASSVADPRVPEEKGYVRGEVLSGGYVIQACPGQPGLSRVTYVTQVDLKGSVPAFVVNKVCESQPQCVNHFRHIAEGEFARLNRNLVKMKQFEDQFPIPHIVQERPSLSPTSSLLPLPRPLEEQAPSLTEPTHLQQEEAEPSVPLPPPAISLVSEGRVNGDSFSNRGVGTVAMATRNEPRLGDSAEFFTDEEEEKEEEKERKGEDELTLSNTDTFNAEGVPSLPIATLLDRIPKYHSDGTESDENTATASVTSSAISSALIDYPRTEEGIDFRTMGNQNAARLLEEMFHISELDLMNPATYRDQSNGWKYQGIEKDVVMLKKKKVSESPFHSFIGKGLIDLSPQEVYNCVRNPNQRFIFDNMLKELHVVKQIEDDLYILHMQHETTQCFLKQSRDFCILVCERSEPNKKVIVGASVEVPECLPQPNCTRGKVMTSGWVIEPYRYREKLLTQVTYLVQVDMGGVPATLVNFVSKRQPLAVAYLRDYLETTSLNSNRNGRDSRPSLLSGADSPSDLTMMYKTYV